MLKGRDRLICYFKRQNYGLSLHLTIEGRLVDLGSEAAGRAEIGLTSLSTMILHSII